jgi:hypothetical protein
LILYLQDENKPVAQEKHCLFTLSSEKKTCLKRSGNMYKLGEPLSIQVFESDGLMDIALN